MTFLMAINNDYLQHILSIVLTRAFALLVVLLLVLGVSQTGLAQKQIPNRPSPPRLVNDYVGILSGGERNALERKLTAYNDSTSTQIAIVIENSLEGADIFTYSHQLAQVWGIGDEEKDNGILIYISFGDRKMGIVTGYGVEGFLPDALSKRIIDNVISPAFRQGAYYQGLDQATDVIFQLGSGEYTADDFGNSEEGIPFIFILLFFLVLFIILSNRGGGGKNDDGGYYRGGRYQRRGGGWVILPGGGWSGSGGGSSWTGGGGGFGGFGGGDFGGGGAFGDW